MIIAIDCRVASSSPTGIGRLFMDAVIAFVKYRKDWTFVLLSPRRLEQTNISSILNESNVKYLCCPLRLFGKDKIWYNTNFIYYAKKYCADLLWTPIPEEPLFSTLGIKKMICAHDVVSIEFSDTQNWKGKYTGKITFKKSIRNADYIWCNSHYTYKKINQYFPDRKCNKMVVGGTCSDAFREMEMTENMIKELKQRFGIRDKFLLFVGSVEPRKNLKYMLSLIKRIYNEDSSIQLLIVGGTGWKNTDIYNYVNSKDFPQNSTIFVPYISTETLIMLYNMADCYISTSLNEGLGLPQIEALKCGCPVISPHNSAMIEVVFGRGITVKGWNEDDWVQAIYDILYSQQRETVDMSEYSWKNIIERVSCYLEN